MYQLRNVQLYFIQMYLASRLESRLLLSVIPLLFLKFGAAVQNMPRFSWALILQPQVNQAFLMHQKHKWSGVKAKNIKSVINASRERCNGNVIITCTCSWPRSASFSIILLLLSSSFNNVFLLKQSFGKMDRKFFSHISFQYSQSEFFWIHTLIWWLWYHNFIFQNWGKKII